MATFNGILRFGSLVIGGVVQPLPSRPWHTNSYPSHLSERGNGDIHALQPGDEFRLWNTPSDPSRAITWAYIKDGNKQIYISTKVLVTNVSYNELNAQGMIYGTPVIIDGKEYKLRVLTETEWIAIVRNLNSISGLPQPTTEDLTDTNTYGQLDGKHNEVWNWWGIWTTCDKVIEGSAMERGFAGVNKVTYISTSDAYPEIGWRPVLERIESNPPEKPYIVTPTGTETEPSVTDTKPMKIETTFNNPGGTFKHMDYEVWDLDLNKRVANTRVLITSDVLTPTLELRHRYKLMVTHTNTADQVSPQATSYFIYGQLNKYKLSEPITQKQYDKLKAYSKEQELVMKPQTFPETESSVIRLLPQTMNTLTVGETNTKELEITTSTKEPVIGDRLIKDKEIYTVSSIEQGIKPINVDKTIETVTNADKPTLSWSYWSGTKSYVYNGYVYLAYELNRDSTQFKIVRIPLQGGDAKEVYKTTSPKVRSLTVVGKDNMLYTISSTESYTFMIAINLDTEQIKIVYLPKDGDQLALSSTIDSKTGYLVLVAKEVNSSTKKYQLSIYWLDVSDLSSVKTVKSQQIITDFGYSDLGNPFIVDIGDIKTPNLGVYFTTVTGDKCELKEYRYNSLTYDGTSTLWIESNIPNALDTEVVAKHIKDKNNESILVISSKYPISSTSAAVRTQMMKKGTQLYPTTTTTSSLPSTQRITYSIEQGIGIVYATAQGQIYKRFTKDYNQPMDRVEYVSTFTPRPASRQQLFEVIDYNPYSYGKYPGLAILDYNNGVDKLRLISDHIVGKPKPTSIILDKPISTSGGEQIKFLDYDLEVKSGESIATITPTNITDTYYEYDAKFDKKEAERKVTVVGRNSKLTTLYYYNY
ncbi:hypothetical protein CF067_00925 [Clostridium sporogenes]